MTQFTDRVHAPQFGISELFRGRWMPSRAINPFAFYFFLALYFTGGMALAVRGFMALVGMAPPLRLQ